MQYPYQTCGPLRYTALPHKHLHPTFTFSAACHCLYWRRYFLVVGLGRSICLHCKICICTYYCVSLMFMCLDWYFCLRMCMLCMVVFVRGLEYYVFIYLSIDYADHHYGLLTFLSSLICAPSFHDLGCSRGQPT